MDAYTLSKVGGLAIGMDQTVTGDPATQAYSMFAEALYKVREAVGYDEEIVCFADGAFLKALQSSPEVSRQIVTSDFKKGEVHLSVRTLDDVKLLPVPGSRLYSAYTFKSGGNGQEEGGFTPYENASRMGFVMLPRRAVSLVKKSETLRTFTPEQNLNADAWKFDYRLYYDVFVKNSMMGAIQVFLMTKNAE